MRVTVMKATWDSRVHNTVRSKYVVGSNEKQCKSYTESSFSARVKPEYINYTYIGDIDIHDSNFEGDDKIKGYFNISSNEKFSFTDELTSHMRRIHGY